MSSRPVDLLHIAYGGSGGHRAYVNGFNDSLAGLGIRTAVLGVTQSSDQQAPARSWLKTDYYSVFPSHPTAFLRRLGLRNLLRDLRPRIVLAHSHGLIPEVLAWTTGHGHSPHLVVREGHAGGLRSWKDNMRSRAALQFADALVFLEREQHVNYPVKYRRSNGRPLVAVIPNGVRSPDSSSTSAQPCSPGKLRLGMAARLVAGKRIDVLIRVIGELSGLGVPVQLFIAGDGPDRGDLELLAARHSDPGQFRFLGDLAPEEMTDFYRSLDMYVHITDGEGESNALLEAASHGLPIVLSDAGGFTGHPERELGVLRVPNTVEVIAAEIAGVYQDSGRLQRLGQLNAQFVASERSFERMTRSYLDLFAQVDPDGPWAKARARMSGSHAFPLMLIE